MIKRWLSGLLNVNDQQSCCAQQAEVNMEELLSIILPGNEQVLIVAKRECRPRTVPFSWFLPDGRGRGREVRDR